MVKVLQTCENNVEAAIRCLTDLRLTPPGEEAVQASTLQSYAAAQSPSSSSAPQGKFFQCVMQVPELFFLCCTLILPYLQGAVRSCPIAEGLPTGCLELEGNGVEPAADPFLSSAVTELEK
jgi:hypothetical protein